MNKQKTMSMILQIELFHFLKNPLCNINHFFSRIRILAIAINVCSYILTRNPLFHPNFRCSIEFGKIEKLKTVGYMHWIQCL